MSRRARLIDSGPSPPSPEVRRLKRIARLAAPVLLVVLVALVVLSAARAGLYDVDRLAREAPRRTALMRAREAAARRAGRAWRPRRVWVPYERISPLLRRAVLIAEDDAFYRHGGLDWNELRAAAPPRPRGAPRRARRQHDHPAARQEPLPRRPAHRHAQADRGVPGAAHGARALQAAHLRAVPEPHRVGRRGLRRRGRGPALLRGVRRRPRRRGRRRCWRRSSSTRAATRRWSRRGASSAACA